MAKDKKKFRPWRFGIVLTYRCNLGCKYCNRYLDVLPWPDSDLSLNDLVVGYGRVKSDHIKIGKARVTGGEPLLHPKFSDACKYIMKTWNRDFIGMMPVFSNGTVPRPEAFGWKYCVSKKSKVELHKPPMISPDDLGLKTKQTPTNYCHRQFGCGALFDAFGFSFCVFAGALGRVLNVDPYEAWPTREKNVDICKHCIFSLGVPWAFRLYAKVESGEIEYPTATYRRAIDRWKSGDVIRFPRFQERSIC